MRDSRTSWREEVARTLANSKLTHEEREEIAHELSGYLEDLSQEDLASGVCRSEATQSAAAELHEDKRLGANLYRARREGSMMNDRTKQLWFPGTVILLATVAFFYLVQPADFGRVWIHHGHRWILAINLPWLCGLPLLGAAAAYWSFRQNAGRAMQVLTGLFPFLVFVAVFFGRPHAILLNYWTVLPIRFASQGFGPFEMSTGFFSGLAWTVVTWVLIPLAALLAGVLPVVLPAKKSQREALRA